MIFFFKEILFYIIAILLTSYFFSSIWVCGVVLVLFLILHTSWTIMLINEFPDAEGHDWGSTTGSLLGSFAEGWFGNPTGQGPLQEMGEGFLGGLFDEDSVDYSDIRGRIWVESIITYVIMIAIFYFLPNIVSILPIDIACS